MAHLAQSVAFGVRLVRDVFELFGQFARSPSVRVVLDERCLEVRHLERRFAVQLYFFAHCNCRLRTYGRTTMPRQFFVKLAAFSFFYSVLLVAVLHPTSDGSEFFRCVGSISIFYFVSLAAALIAANFRQFSILQQLAGTCFLSSYVIVEEKR